MAIQFTNDASTFLAANISAAATSITVADASSFPALGATDHTYITLSTPDNSAKEIVKCTAISGTTLTVIRAQEGTTAQSFTTSDRAQIRITAQLFRDVMAAFASLDTFKYTATAGQTTFSGSDTNAATLTYTLNNIIVILNGISLDASDFTATSGTSIVLATGAAADDELVVVAFKSFTLADHYDKTASDAKYRTLTGDQSHGDNVKAKFGNSDDLAIFHDGSNSYITDTTGGNFFINDDGAGYLMMKGSDLYFRNPSNVDMIHAQSGGYVKLYHNGSEKLETTSSGVDISGTVTAVGGAASNNDDANIMTLNASEHARLLIDTSSTSGHRATLALESNGNETTLSNTGANSYLTADTGQLFLKSAASNVWLNGTECGMTNTDDTEYLIRATSNGSVKLYYDGVKKLETTSSGVDISGTVTADGLTVAGSDYQLRINQGSNQPYYIRHASDNSLRMHLNGTGDYVTIDSSGNVGIGVTPESWNTGGYVTGFDMGGGAIFSYKNGANLQFNLLSNSYYSGTGYKYSNSGSAAAHEISNGGHYFQVAPSGTADSAISWTTAMTIDNSGNVLVGTTATDTAAVGFRYRASLDAISSVSDGGISAYFGRRSSDGDIVAFRKNDAIVGSIGTTGGEMYIGSGDCALRFNDGGDQIRVSTSTGSNRDGAIDLGFTDSRFKDGHFSGTVNAGGLVVNAGASNVVATFESTDSVGAIELKDSSGTCELSTSNSGFSVQPNGGASVLTVDSSGNMDISGTTGQISSASTDEGAVLRLSNKKSFENGYDGNAFVGGIEFYTQDSSEGGPQVFGAIKQRQLNYYNNQAMCFFTSTYNGSLTERLRIDSSGNSIFGGGSLYGSNTVSITAASGIDQRWQSGVAHSNLQNAISGVSNGFQTEQDSSNNLTYTFHTGANAVGLKLDSSGNLGIGVTPESWHTGYNALQIGGRGFLAAHTGSDCYLGQNAYYNNGWKYIDTGNAASFIQQSGGLIQHFVAPSGTADSAISWTTAMTIDNSGRVIMGTSTTGNHPSWFGSGTRTGLCIQGGGGGPHVLYLKNNDTSGGANMIQFVDGSGDICGAINSNATSNTTSYSTTSDYRAKENVTPMTNASERLMQLKPSNFNFITDPETLWDGFLAHEAQAVVPESVVGDKDAMRDEEYEVTPAIEATFDDEGEELTAAVDAVMGTRSVPDMQGIDQSKLVPLLTAALQEALARIEALENK